jgi:hypothetical protein
VGTLIGRRERVAIEFELTPTPQEHRKWIFGLMCLWIGGERIGRHDEEVAMTVALTSFRGILDNAGKRNDATLMSMPAAEAFATIYRPLYGDEYLDLSYREISDLSRRFEPFEITTSGFDYFDGWKAFLIENELAGRVLWRSPDGAIHEKPLGAGEFDRVLGGFLNELERVYAAISVS